MNIFEAIFLGILQGLTEFLPVSSSGHLVIFQNLFGLKEPELFFDTMLHLGTLIAVVIVFRSDIIILLRSFFLFIRKIPSRTELKNSFNLDPNQRLIALILICLLYTSPSP
ncbi:MAG: hypothetical protein N3A64_03780, partial [Desulfobacterota bacterium]|nr:hypothetical protein [Thermodesulfobacteriota bacterium]